MTEPNPRAERSNGIALRVVLTMLAAGSLGGLLALPLGDQQQVSIEVWLTIVSALLALAVIARMLKATPVQAAPSEPAFRRPEGHVGIMGRLLHWWIPPTVSHRRLPASLIPIQGQLLSARDNERAFARRLQPRLVHLADHYLRTDHGVMDLGQEDRVRDILGDSAWLIDPAVTGRTPTIPELEELLDRLLSERTSPEGPQTE